MGEELHENTLSCLTCRLNGDPESGYDDGDYTQSQTTAVVAAVASVGFMLEPFKRILFCLSLFWSARDSRLVIIMSLGCHIADDCTA